MAENIVRDYFGATTPDWLPSASATAATFGPSYADYESAAQVRYRR